MSLLISPIFTGLTRPPMLMGVTLDYMCGCGLVLLCLFILANNPLYLLLYLPLHAAGWIALKLDHHIFRVFMKWLDCAYVPNKKIWVCHSFEPF